MPKYTGPKVLGILQLTYESYTALGLFVILQAKTYFTKPFTIQRG